MYQYSLQVVPTHFKHSKDKLTKLQQYSSSERRVDVSS